jgi:hypothetical protein
MSYLGQARSNPAAGGIVRFSQERTFPGLAQRRPGVANSGHLADAKFGPLRTEKTLKIESVLVRL